MSTTKRTIGCQLNSTEEIERINLFLISWQARTGQRRTISNVLRAALTEYMERHGSKPVAAQEPPNA